MNLPSLISTFVVSCLDSCEKNRSSGFSTRSDTNRAVQPHKVARGLKFCIQEVEGLYYLCSENKGADQLRSYREADLRLCFRICKKPVFSRCGSKGSPFITLCLGSIELDRHIRESLYKGTILYINYRKMSIWEPRHGRVVSKTTLYGL